MNHSKKIILTLFAISFSILAVSYAHAQSSNGTSADVQADPQIDGLSTTSTPAAINEGTTNVIASNSTDDIIKDSTSTIVPVIITFKDQPTSDEINQFKDIKSIKRINLTDEQNLVKSYGGNITQDSFFTLNAIVANVSQDKIEIIKQDPLVLGVDRADIQVIAEDLAADQQIRVDQVWANGYTGSGVPVAILDSGIDNTHPEFSGRIAKCHSEINSPNTCNDNNGHGTHVAGIAVATGVDPNAKGVAPTATLYIDQVLDGPPLPTPASGTAQQLINGIDWARTNGAKVISMSLGFNDSATQAQHCDLYNTALTTVINNAYSAGITIVAAAGNHLVDSSHSNVGVTAPGCISNVLAVGAVDSTNTIASFSNQGGAMANHGIVAPGVNIYSTLPGHVYGTLSGTSMATPHVSGLVALMLQKTPNLAPKTIKNMLFFSTCKSTSTPSCPPITGTPNNAYGYGRIDALRAYAPTVSVSPSTGKVGQSVSVSGNNGYAASSTVTITYDGTNPATTTTTSTGTWVKTYTIPPSTKGPHTILATDGISTANTTFTVTPSISLSPTSGPVDQSVSITGNGFAANSDITITYDGTNPSTAGTDQTGSFFRIYTIPSSTVGPHTIAATDSSSNTANATYTVVGCAPTSGDWVISSSCTLATSFTATGNVIVQSPAVLTIPNGVQLNIDFTQYHLLVNSGSGVLINPGGKIT